MEGEGVRDEDDALGRAGGGGHGDKFEGEGALEWDEAELVAIVVTENETDDSVAESADAVVEENRAAFDLGALHCVHCGRYDSYTV